MSRFEDERLGETYAPKSAEQHAQDIADSLKNDINQFAEVMADPCEAPGFLKALFDLCYGNDALDAALRLRSHIRFELGEWSADELERRIRGKPRKSAIAKRLEQSVLLSEFKAGKFVEFPARDKP